MRPEPTALAPVVTRDAQVHKKSLGEDGFTRLYANTATIREAISNKKNLKKQAEAAREEAEDVAEDQRREMAQGVGLGLTNTGVGISATAKPGRK